MNLHPNLVIRDRSALKVAGRMYKSDIKYQESAPQLFIRDKGGACFLAVAGEAP